MRISDWSSDVCSSDLLGDFPAQVPRVAKSLVQALAHEWRRLVSRIPQKKDVALPPPIGDQRMETIGRGPPDAALIGAQLGREKAPDILLARNFCGILAGKDHEFPAAQSTRSPNIGAGAGWVAILYVRLGDRKSQRLNYSH